jgi:hypothetical protein
VPRESRRSTGENQPQLYSSTSIQNKIEFFSIMSFIQDLVSILPMPDAVVVLRITGT